MANARSFRKTMIFSVTLIAVFMMSFSETAHARKHHRRHRHRARAKKVINEPKLYERIGGSKGVSDLVDEWLRQNIADTRLTSQMAGRFEKPDQLARWRKSWTEQLCELAEGPCVARSLKTAKKGSDKSSDPVREILVLDDTPFLQVSENLFKSMQKQGLREREKNEMLGRLGGIRSDATADDDSDSSADSSKI